MITRNKISKLTRQQPKNNQCDIIMSIQMHVEILVVVISKWNNQYNDTSLVCEFFFNIKCMWVVT